MTHSASSKFKDHLASFMVGFLMAWDDIRDTLINIVVTVLACLLFTTYLYKPVMVSGTSMYPTIEDGSLGFSSVVLKNTRGIERFDIVVIHLEGEENIIKRVIGMPGETVSFRDDTLYINGVPLSQDFLDETYTSQYSQFTSDFEYSLGDDQYFCMGDNRPVSADSRVFGPFTAEQIVSCGLFVIYPFSQFGDASN